MRRVNLLMAHGSPTSTLYRNRGCRCVACRAAHREGMAAYRAANRGACTARAAAYYAAHREEAAAYHAAHRERHAAREQERKYGLLPGERDAMLTVQGGGCAICGTTEPGGRYGTWHTDHSHDTGDVRGLLCSRCNIGLGTFRDDPEHLMAAIEYLAAATL